MNGQPKENPMRHTESIWKNKRAWILLLGGLAATVWLGTQIPFSSKSQAQETAQPSESDQSKSSTRTLQFGQVDGNDTRSTSPPPGHRMVTETRMVWETYDVTVPVGDPADKKFRSETRTRWVPVQTTRWVPVGDPATNGEYVSQINRLVQELKRMEHDRGDSNQSEAKTSQLQELLNGEFTRMHEQQAAEIESTEKRLDGLKKLHEQRGDKQAEIVQRRIDQLLGKTNPLDWNVNTPATITPRPFSGTLKPPVVAYPPNNGYAVRPNDGREFQTLQPLPITPNVPPDSAPSSDSRDQHQFNPINQNDIFTVIGKANEAHLAELSTKLSLENTQRLFDQRIISSIELRKATIEHTTAQNAVAVLKLQLESMHRTLQRELADAVRQVKSEAESMKATWVGGSEAEKGAARRIYQDASKAAATAKETLSEFEKALRLVPFMNITAGASLDPANALDDQQPTKETDERPEIEDSAPPSPSSD